MADEANVPQAQPSQPAAGERWEYWVDKFDDLHHMEENLNNAGAQGWEVVNISSTTVTRSQATASPLVGPIKYDAIVWTLLMKRRLP